MTLIPQEARTHEVAAARAAMKEVEAEERLRSGLAELDAIERMARRQLATARWRQALILQCSGHKQSLFRLPSARRASHQPVLQQVLSISINDTRQVKGFGVAPKRRYSSYC